MLLHDATDIPADLYHLAVLSSAPKPLLKPLLGLVIASWAYWRIYYLPSTLIYSAAVESKSHLFPSTCVSPLCTLYDVPERVPFVAALCTLLGLHVLWLIQFIHLFIYGKRCADLWLLQTAYNSLFRASGTSSSTSAGGGGDRRYEDAEEEAMREGAGVLGVRVGSGAGVGHRLKDDNEGVEERRALL